MALVIALVATKRAFAAARSVLAMLSVLAMVLMPALHVAADPTQAAGQVRAMTETSATPGEMEGHGSHRVGPGTAADTGMPGGPDAPGADCIDLAGCPVHALLAAAPIAFAGAAARHAVAFVESSDLRAAAAGTDIPPPRFLA